HFAVSGLPSTTAGDAHNFTVTSLDAYGNTAPDYTGTVQITSSDPHANLPDPYTFTSVSGGDIGRHTFAATLVTSGTQSITAKDGSITGTESGIAVNPAAAAQLVFGPPPAAVAGQVLSPAGARPGRARTNNLGTPKPAH